MEELQQSEDGFDLGEISKWLNKAVDYCHSASYNSGWWSNLDTGEDVELTVEMGLAKLMLVTTEISEAAEGLRKDLMDDHLPDRKMVEVELADAVVRIFDLAGKMGLDIGGGLTDKVEYNKNRSDHKIENRKKDGGKKA